jgi:hypothetical protein
MKITRIKLLVGFATTSLTLLLAASAAEWLCARGDLSDPSIWRVRGAGKGYAQAKDDNGNPFFTNCAAYNYGLNHGGSLPEDYVVSCDGEDDDMPCLKCNNTSDVETVIIDQIVDKGWNPASTNVLCTGMIIAGTCQDGECVGNMPTMDTCTSNVVKYAKQTGSGGT